MQRELKLLVPVAALVLSACGGDGDAVSVDGVWARTSPMATDRGAVYFDIEAADADTLVGVSVSSSIAGDAQIHEMVMADMGDDSMDDMDGDSMGDESMDDMDGEAGSEMDDMDDAEHSDEMADMPMMMQEMTDGLTLPAGEVVSLAPGGFHVMLLDLVDPLETGESFELTLDFADADDVTIEVPVLETAP